jgi:hypothetical protein
MLTDFPEFQDKIQISHLEISSKKVLEKYGIVQSPAVAINEILINQGHVPTINKLKMQFQKVITNE